ncbi:hypothetical protein [Amycolatopsis sp. GM8]|uniref:hypothetical protein n=1 Tax=Amycolatopsis sp. GM8 TaxID=2896530 RepID=UPI001F328045|nr:hypothetical protein [Amycolatopsis sp. GM8]
MKYDFAADVDDRRDERPEHPDAASSIPMRSTVMVPAKVTTTVRRARRATVMVRARWLRSELIRMMSALSRAMPAARSVPDQVGSNS